MSTRRSGDRINVMVELRVGHSQDVSAVSARLKTSGFEIDHGYPAICVRAMPAHEHEPASRESDVRIVRGTIAQSRLASLEDAPHVLRVWHDGPISQRPFTPSEQHGSSPVGPCDCTNGTVAQGTLEDTVSYLGVDKIWAAGNRGAGVVVGLVDCGVCALGRSPRAGETPIVPNVIGGYPSDWGTTSRASTFWFDHGNMTATDLLGIAPQAHLYDIRITDGFDGHEAVLLTNALAGFDWAINHYRRFGKPHILTNSWGLHAPRENPDYASDPHHPLTRKIVEAIDAGILVLFSAGNCGATCPAGYCGEDVGGGRDIWGANGHPRVMTVGAANLCGELLGSSSTGPSALNPHGIKPDFCAISQFAGYYPNSPTSPACDAGTSAATAITAGVLALLKERFPALDQASAKQLLMQTAKSIGPTPINQLAGAGIIQASSAWQCLPL